MKKSTGILVLAFALLALFLYTCAGPSSSDRSRGNEPVDTGVQDKPTPTADADPVPAVIDEADPEAGRDPVRPRPISSRAPEPGRVDDPVDVATPDQSLLPPLETVPVPVPGMEAMLAVHPRDLEGGSGSAVLIPVDTLRAQLRIPIAERNGLPTDFTRGQPASTINTPTAYGQRLGDVFAGAAYQERIRYDDWSDGVASVGFGLGDPVTYLGLDVAVNILDTYTEFAEDRSLSIKLHRRLPFRSAVAVGHENLWHTDGTDGGSSRFVVVSKVVLLRDQPTASLGSMVVNVGLGNDRFLSEDQFARGNDGINPFGSVAVRVLPPMNAIANWTGQDLALGLSIAPVRRWPLVITPAVMDLTGNAGDGARFSVSAGLNYNFRR